MTVLELIKGSLRLIGAIASSETPTANAQTDALESLNLLLGELHNDGLVALTESQTFNVASGTQTYTIGPAMTWVGNKPLKVIAAFLTLDSVDYPLAVIGENQYMEISDKTAEERPRFLYYCPSNSTGTVYLVGKPEQAYTITILSLKAFTAMMVGATIDLPDGYLTFLKYALAVEIAPEYESIPSEWIIRQRNEKLAAIKRTNLKKPKPMQFDGIFAGGNGFYNAATDTWS
ncbi:MAG: hypothetical protein PHN44_01340 [Candidatus Marinimicrobia bacterium]|nr:hypothetical protein [Candidatus Neomarinimicrobiota bacterium]